MNQNSVSEEMIYAARNGDKTAMNRLIAALAPAVEKIAGAYADRCSLSRCDLIQEGMLGLLSAVYGYRPDGSAEFKTYSCTCITNRIVSAVRSQLRGKNAPLNSYVPLEDVELSNFEADPQTVVDMQEKIQSIEQKIKAELTKLEREVLELHIAGHNYSYIAATLSINEKSVDNALQRARKKLRED
ncbi:MAG: sigma-70 family RNA polymerase sigma factor [Clostridia bacterium]|nr:sigma-70 family RNA polymerase sigma factor [Clostridia bacterium]